MLRTTSSLQSGVAHFWNVENCRGFGYICSWRTIYLWESVFFTENGSCTPRYLLVELWLFGWGWGVGTRSSLLYMMMCGFDSSVAVTANGAPKAIRIQFLEC